MSDNHQDDFSMAFVDSCDKLTLLLIHGFPLNSTMWSPQIDELEGYVRVIAPDLRGHGNTDAVDGPYQMSQLADDCADLLGHLGVATPFVVCGLSMGGYVALEFYRRYPEYVAGLVLTATRAGADSDEGKANRDKAVAGIQENGVDGLIDGMLPKLVTKETAVSDPDTLSFIRQIMEKTTDVGAIGALQGMRDRSDSTDLLSEISVPTLIIHGKDDQLIPISEAEVMHKAIKNSKLVVLENAGHLPNLENVDEFNDVMIDFLEEIEATLQEEG
ncbi:MAG: alpha/beta fold hydrolase [Chloroflexi bacterium]|nr:alpha/beta fold hydrolase [Chloroflexota bacterium]